MTKPPLKVIEGTPAPDTPLERTLARIRKHRKPEHIIRCHRCTGTAMIQVRLGMTYRNGKPVGGQKQFVCATCLLNGQSVTAS